MTTTPPPLHDPSAAPEPGSPFAAPAGSTAPPAPYVAGPGAPLPAGGWVPPQPSRTDGVSIAALVTGILGMALVPLGLGIAGVVRTKSPARSGRGLAVAGIVLGALSTVGWALIAVLVVLAASSDEVQDVITESYQQGLQEGAGLDYAVGECFDLPADATALDAITPADCAAPHTSEVVGVHLLPNGGFPGDDGVMQAFQDLCVPSFEEYVGSDPGETSLGMYYIGPDSVSWAIGDRQLLCVVESGDGAPRTGSVAGSGL